MERTHTFSRMGRWMAIAIAVVLALVGFALLGPFGVLIALPALLILLFLLGSSSGGPAAGA